MGVQWSRSCPALVSLKLTAVLDPLFMFAAVIMAFTLKAPRSICLLVPRDTIGVSLVGVWGLVVMGWD